METFRLDSDALGNARDVLLFATGPYRSCPTVIFLDAEYYVERMDAPALIHRATDQRRLPTANYVFVSHINGDIRWPESFCNEDFARCIGNELVPTLVHALGLESSRWFLGGLSLTGLAAVHAALTGPYVFDGVFAQSGSFWWNENWLADAFDRFETRDTRIRLSCGRDETQADVDHGNGLFQSTPQLASNELIRDRLLDRGFDVDFAYFDGGHSLACWADELPRALASLLNRD